MVEVPRFVTRIPEIELRFHRIDRWREAAKEDTALIP